MGPSVTLVFYSVFAAAYLPNSVQFIILLL